MVVSSGPNMYIIKTKKNSKSCILGKMYLKSFSPASCYQQNIVFCVKKLKEDKIPAERGGAWFSNFAPSPSPIDKQNQSLRERGQFSLLFSTFSAVFDLPALAVEENGDFINQSCPPYTTLQYTTAGLQLLILTDFLKKNSVFSFQSTQFWRTLYCIL